MLQNKKIKESNNFKPEINNKSYNDKFSSTALLNSFILDRLSEKKKKIS